MTYLPNNLQPGDILVVRTPPTFFEKVIRIGALLLNKDTLQDHVAIFHHIDAAGVPWCIEGRPGGVGWQDLRTYDNKYLVSNVAQDKHWSTRLTIQSESEKMLGTRYDWAAIAEDGLEALRLDNLWQRKDFDKGLSPARVVCSSFAAWLYDTVNLERPNTPMRFTEPADWSELFLAKGWH